MSTCAAEGNSVSGSDLTGEQDTGDSLWEFRDCCCCCCCCRNEEGGVEMSDVTGDPDAGLIPGADTAADVVVVQLSRSVGVDGRTCDALASVLVWELEELLEELLIMMLELLVMTLGNTGASGAWLTSMCAGRAGWCDAGGNVTGCDGDEGAVVGSTVRV